MTQDAPDRASVRRGYTGAQMSANPPATWLQRIGHDPLFAVGDAGITAFDLIEVMLVVAGAFAVSWLARRALREFGRRREPGRAAAFYAVGRMLHYLLVVIGAMIALEILGIDLSRLTLFVSALGVGLGFGLQGVIGNFVSGLIILFERHLKNGDFVELESGVTGEVREINFRATRITTNDNIDMLVPNMEFANGRVVNWTLKEMSRRLRIKFGVSYGADKSKVREAALQAAAAVPFTRTDEEHRPQVWLVGFGDSSLDFELVVWLLPEAIKRPATVHAAYCWAIDDALRAASIEIPFPHRDLHLRSVFGLDGEAARRFVHGAPVTGDADRPRPPPSGSANDALEEAMRLGSQDGPPEPPADEPESRYRIPGGRIRTPTSARATPRSPLASTRGRARRCDAGSARSARSATGGRGRSWSSPHCQAP